MSTTPATRGNGQQPTARAQQQPSEAVKNLLIKATDRLQAVLPKHMTPARTIQIATNLVFRNPRLQECDPASIVMSVLQACELGLDLTPSAGEAYLIPRWNGKARVLECQFQPGYQGLLKLARNTGQILDVGAELVHERDIFHRRRRPQLEFLHEPYDGPDRGPVVKVYAYAILASGETKVEVMTADEVEEIHKRSEGYRRAQSDGKPEQGPWVTDWSEMARKTVLRRIMKYLPRSVELIDVIEKDSEEFQPGPQPLSIEPAAEVPALSRPRSRGDDILARLSVGKPSQSTPAAPATARGQALPAPVQDDLFGDPPFDADADVVTEDGEVNPPPKVDFAAWLASTRDAVATEIGERDKQGFSSAAFGARFLNGLTTLAIDGKYISPSAVLRPNAKGEAVRSPEGCRTELKRLYESDPSTLFALVNLYVDSHRPSSDGEEAVREPGSDDE